MSKTNIYTSDIPAFLQHIHQLPEPYVDEIAPRYLARSMGDISENSYYANWLTNLEYRLWAILQGHQRKRGKTTDEEIKQLRALSDICKGWVVYDGGETLVSMSDWIVMYDKWRTDNGV